MSVSPSRPGRLAPITRLTACLTLCAASLCAAPSAHAEGSFLESIFGDGSGAEAHAGFWYAFWSPTEIPGVDVSVDPALLTQTGIRMTLGQSVNFAVQYLADDIFDTVEFETERQIGEEATRAARLLIAALDYVYDESILLQGRGVFGRFEGEVESQGGFVDGQDLPAGTAFGFATSFSNYEANLLWNIGWFFNQDEFDPNQRLTAGLGVRVNNYRSPVELRFTPLEEVPDPRTGTTRVNRARAFSATSDYRSISAQLVAVDAQFIDEESFFAANFIFYLGRATYENDFIDEIGGTVFGFDTSVEFGQPIFLLDGFELWWSLGGRLMGQVVEIGDVIDESNNPRTRLKQDLQDLAAGTEGRGRLNSSDYFYGPTAALRARF